MNHCWKFPQANCKRALSCFEVYNLDACNQTSSTLEKGVEDSQGKCLWDVVVHRWLEGSSKVLRHPNQKQIDSWFISHPNVQEVHSLCPSLNYNEPPFCWLVSISSCDCWKGDFTLLPIFFTHTYTDKQFNQEVWKTRVLQPADFLKTEQMDGGEIVRRRKRLSNWVERPCRPNLVFGLEVPYLYQRCFKGFSSPSCMLCWHNWLSAQRSYCIYIQH